MTAPETVLLQAAAASTAPALPAGGYGASLLQSLLALAAVCLLAWVVLRWVATRGALPGLPASLGARGARRLEVVERMPLDAKRALWLVRVDGRTLLVGTGDGGAPTLLGDVGVSGEIAAAAGDGDPAHGQGARPVATATQTPGPT